MSYLDKNTNDVIQSSDYNDMASKVRLVYEDLYDFDGGIYTKAYFGYGSGKTGGQDDDQAPYIRVSRSIEDLITGEDWARLIRAILACQFHQGISLHDTNQSMIDLVDGDLANGEITEGMPIEYLDVLNIAVADITTYAMSLTDEAEGYRQPTNLAIDTRIEEWSGIISHKFKLRFTSLAHARYFFNTGGDVRFSGANEPLPGILEDMDIDEQWQAGLLAMGTVIFNYGCTVNEPYDGQEPSDPEHPRIKCILSSDIISDDDDDAEEVIELYPDVDYYTNGAGFYDVVSQGIDEANAYKIFEFSIGGAGGGGIYADDLVLITSWVDDTVSGEYNLWFDVQYISASGGVVGEMVTGTITSNIDVMWMSGITYPPYELLSLNVPYVEVLDHPTYVVDTMLSDPPVPINPT